MQKKRRLFFIGIDGLNRPMAQTFIKEGKMPTLKSLIEKGAEAEVFPCFPAYTPTNWATLCTGANTGTHGLPGWTARMPDGQEVTSFVSCALRAQTIWEAAERAGHKVCLFNYAASMPSVLKNGCAVDNTFGNVLHPAYFTPEKLSEPPEVARELQEKFGPYITRKRGPGGKLSLEEWDKKGQWVANAARYLMEEKGYTFFYSHFHVLDSLMHEHLDKADPASPSYDPGSAQPHFEALKEGHAIVDRYVANLIRNATQEDVIIVTSDHGNSPNLRMVDVNQFLLQNGYLVLRTQAKDGVEKIYDFDRDAGISMDTIDWKRTVAYRKPTKGGFDIYVTAKGEEYETVRDRLVKDLRTWVDDETGKTVMAIVLKREDAQPIGYWGEDCGDVIGVYEKGYGWKKLPEGKVLGPGSGANHGSQFPTAGTDFASVLAYMVLNAPGMKQGYMRDPTSLGYVNMIDIVPTLCHLLRIDPPNHSQGTVLRDFEIGVDVTSRRTDVTPELLIKR